MKNNLFPDLDYKDFDVKIENKYKINKKIRLIELFAGYSSQALSLKYLNVPFESHKIVEWEWNVINSNKEIHYTNINIDYTNNMTKEDIVDYLFNKNISNDGKSPMTREQINRKKIDDLKYVYNNIQITKNLVDITQVKGSNLEIKDTDKYEYIMTYSFPCTDLSLAGKGAGMKKGESTRSGLLWEVERILNECEELPQILLMENVTEVHGKKNLKDFNDWLTFLQRKGYKNYWKDLNSKNFEIPQNRDRTFMISILGDYNYKFPTPLNLNLRLNDMLEENVDEKYYLSGKMIEQIQNWNAYEKPLENMTKTHEKQICPTITTRSCAFAAGVILIPENTKQGYAIARDGDGVYINRPHQKRGVVQNQMIQTLKTQQDVGVVVNYINSDKFLNNKSRFKKTNLIPTIETKNKYGIVENNEIITTILEKEKLKEKKLRIRKLTAKECFRLMGVKDEDYNKITCSDSQKYKQAGNSIVVNVLMAIFKELIE